MKITIGVHHTRDKILPKVSLIGREGVSLKTIYGEACPTESDALAEAGVIALGLQKLVNVIIEELLGVGDA